MEQTELEEGEALSSQNEAPDSTIDPDIALSYIDEKLQNVLGHFQKDFEGGVSAENLGAKFGGYGSFLPTYQRSPTWFHTRSPAEDHHNYDSPRSPKKLHVEDHRQNLFVSSSSSPSARSRIASGKAAPLGSNLKGNNNCLQSRHAEETSLRSADVKKSVNSSDQRTLKFRIKVGSKSLSTQSNAEIYSGLGLGVSSSSSLDDSPTTNGQFGKFKEAPEASPTSILQIMTSSPGGLILSPLSEDLICLTEKRKPRERVETKREDNTSVESSGMLEKGSFFSKGNKKKSKLSEKGCLSSVELKNQKNNGNNKSVQSVGRVENSNRKLGSLSEISEFKRESLVSNNAACSPIDQSESVSSGRKCEEAVKPALEKSFTVGKKKPKMVYTTGTQGASSSKVAFRDLHKDLEKPGDRYRVFFGDTEFEDEDKKSSSGEMKSPGRLKSPLVVGKRTSIDDHNMPKEKFDIKFSRKLPEAQENYPAASQSAHPNGNGLSSEAPVGSVPLVQEDWVSCDKCQKWRLLPLGTNVSCLPDKWLCRMLTWLPGMNRCSIPQEETTNALRALYHPSASIPGPTSETQHSQLNYNSAVNSAKMASADAYLSQENQNLASQTVTLSRKRKHGLAKAAISNDRDDSNSFNSRRTSLGTSAITNSLNSGKYLPSRQLGFAVENFSDHKKETSSLSNSSDRGTIVKIKTKREADMSGSRALKRMKSEGLHVGDTYWTSDNGGMTSKAGCPTTNFSYDTSRIDKPKSNEHEDFGQPKQAVLPGTKEETQVLGTLVNGLLFSENYDDKDSLRKRKAKDPSDQRKEKKTRISKSGGKDINGRKPTVNPLGAANSSSSMVSSSHKSKIIGQEVKGVLSGEDGREMSKKDAVLFADKPVTDVPHVKYISVKNSTEQYKVEEKANIVQSLKKSGKGLSSHAKDKTHASGSVLDGVHNSSHDSLGCEHLVEGPKSRSTPGKGEKFTGQKDNAGGTSSESSKGQKQKKLAHDEKYINKSQDKKHHIHQEHYKEKLTKRSNQAEANGNGKSHSLLALARFSTEPVSGTGKENSVKNSAFELDNADGQEAPNHRKKSESLNCHPIRHSTLKSHKARDIDVPSPVRRDSSSHAANSALKEAKGLKHMADRLKNSGSTESIGLYFQAALKFLHGASLMETGSSEATEQNELMHSMHIYRSTAKLCEFCAHEYEKLKDMAAAALAYKCMEVAYLCVVYSSYNSSSKDLNELQTALQIVPPGESPSSSASDVDNLNHQATDKASLAKVVGSAQVSGSHILAARSRSGFLRILNFTRDVNFAMQASRRSKIALMAASEKLSESSDIEILDSIKRALDFSFHDVEGLLCLIRLAMEAINR